VGTRKLFGFVKTPWTLKCATKDLRIHFRLIIAATELFRSFSFCLIIAIEKLLNRNLVTMPRGAELKDTQHHGGAEVRQDLREHRVGQISNVVDYYGASGACCHSDFARTDFGVVKEGNCLPSLPIAQMTTWTPQTALPKSGRCVYK